MFKKYFTIFFISFLALFINENLTSAASNDLSIDGEYITKDPVTGKYSSDWSHLDTPENIQLQKDVQNYFSQKQSQKLNLGVQTQQSQLNYVEDLNKRIDEFLSQIDPEIAALKSKKSNTFSAASSYGLPGIDQATVKILEGKIHLSLGILSASNIAAAIENSNGARDHAIRYAQDKNYYITVDGKKVLKTWDNASDALRHFAWNFMNSNDMGVNKARTAGDVHEVALVALDYLNNDIYTAQLCKFNLSCMETEAAKSAIADWNSSKNSLTYFNKTFHEEATIMDLLNNTKGRQAYQQGYSNYSTPFNIFINNGSLIQFPTSITSTLRTTAWNGFR